MSALFLMSQQISTIPKMFILMLFVCQLAFAYDLPPNHALHLPLYRRGGRFLNHKPANLTELLAQLKHTETRYHRTYRHIEGNHLVRKWNSEQDEQVLLDGAGLDGTWYTTINVGSPLQSLEVDLDFLNPDFYTILTTSTEGSKFNTFFSSSHVSGNDFVHPYCRLPSDDFHFHGKQTSIRLDWPVCQPSKSSKHTLSRSGSTFGLAPNPQSHSSTLSRLTTPSLVHRLHQNGIIKTSVWSITLLDSKSGILSLGGTLAAEFEAAKARTEAELKYLGQQDAAAQVDEEVNGKMTFAMPSDSTLEDQFKWTDVSGPSGWWTGLMNGIWVNGVKVLKNQPFLIDLSCPFIIAPPTAFASLYSSIGGSMPLHPSFLANVTAQSDPDQAQQHFHLFPCLNPPSIALELAGWPFPLASPQHTTREDAIHGPAGGLFSLGKVKEVLGDSVGANDSGTVRMEDHVNSGYCVGIVVQSDMGERRDKRWQDSGMQDTWVLGEPFFRGMGIVFDDGDRGKARMGFRQY